MVFVAPGARAGWHDARVARGHVGRPSGMRKTLSVVGSVAVSSLLGWVGGEFGIMTGFILGTIGSGIGMYAGYKLAARLS
jgi:hypothetical protein